MKKWIALLLAMTMALGMLAGCGADTPTSTAPEETSMQTQKPAPEATPAEPGSDDTASVLDVPGMDGFDNTQDNANLDFTAHREMLKTLHTELPLVDEPVTLSYFLGFESSALNYVEGGDLHNQQVWKWLVENTGVNLELTVVERSALTDKLNLMIASGTYTDLMNLHDYSAGIETAYEEEIITDLTDYVEENMPNYWTIINSDDKLRDEVTDGGMILGLYPIKDQVANPADMGPFIRKDWLEDLDLEVPQTYDELESVLEAFQSEKGATEPMALYSTISMADGLLIGGFGSMAELSSTAVGGANPLNAYYQEDGEVIYGATQDGTRKFLSWLHGLNEKNLINFENMQNRYTDPFGELTMTYSADGTNGYMFSNQPFGGNYSTIAASQYGDEKCNWWPVQDVAETAGQTIPFYEEVTLIDATATCISVSSQCENVEAALKFIDYGYSYEGALLYNYGFEIGSGHDVETWSYDSDGEPKFEADRLLAVADVTNIASAVVSTKDLAGIVFDTRLAFEFGERELSCFDAWSTNKNNDQILGSATTLNSEEGAEAASIYSDIITYVSTCALQFINGDLDIDDDAVWDEYVEKIESMDLDALTNIIQTAYDRAHS